MAENKIICTTNDVEYLTIRKAMSRGGRSFDEIASMTGVCGECEGCRNELDWILSSVCGCLNVSLASVVEAVQNGADTMEKVGEVTGAGTDCGRCQILIENVIQLGR